MGKVQSGCVQAIARQEGARARAVAVMVGCIMCRQRAKGARKYGEDKACEIEHVCGKTGSEDRRCRAISAAAQQRVIAPKKRSPRKNGERKS